MEEQTSFSTEESLFSDVTADDIAEMSGDVTPDEPEQQAEETAQEEKQEAISQDAQQEQAEKFTLRSFGKDIELTKEELIKAGQKGLDYDRIRAPYDKINALAQEAKMSVDDYIFYNLSADGRKEQMRMIGLLQEIATLSGKNVNDFLSELSNQGQQIQIQKRADELVRSGDYSESAARKMAEMEMKLNSQQKMQEKVRLEQSKAEQAKKSVGEFIMKNPEFMKEFPNAQLPPEMMQSLNNGASISEAWTAYQFNKQTKAMQEMQAELDKYRQIEKNKQAAAPKIKGDMENEAKDPFLEGLLG